MDELKPMLNLECSQARLGYGGILIIDLGDLIKYDHGTLFYGKWQVRSYSGMWRIYETSNLVSGAYDDEPILEAAINLLLNRQLISVELSEHSSDARLRFSDSLFVEFMEASSKEDNWEVIGPQVHISFGPGPTPRVSGGDEANPGLTPEEARICDHADECAKRWEQIIPPQASVERSCRRCAYYMPLLGMWYFWDFGLCTNPSSPFDGKVANVGTGCTEYAAEF